MQNWSLAIRQFGVICRTGALPLDSLVSYVELEPCHQIVWCHMQNWSLAIRQFGVICRTGASPLDSLVSYQDALWGILPLCRDAVGVFYSFTPTDRNKPVKIILHRHSAASKTTAVRPSKPSADYDSGFRHDFRPKVSLPLA